MKKDKSNTANISQQGALFGRSDVARLLGIKEWLLANFADVRYRYGLAPSVSGGRGRGKKSFYTVADVYKIATANRLLEADIETDTIPHVIRELFPQTKDPMTIAVTERATHEAMARHVVIDFAMATFFAPSDGKREQAVTNEWHGEAPPDGRRWVSLLTTEKMVEEIRRGTLRAFFAMPFDALLNWVDTQILGREVTFDKEIKER